MGWHELVDEDDPWHVLYVLLNDRSDVLARIETHDAYVFDVWVMDRDDTTRLRQAGLAAYPIKLVKIYAMRLLEGRTLQDHTTAAELRPMKTAWPA